MIAYTPISVEMENVIPAGIPNLINQYSSTEAVTTTTCILLPSAPQILGETQPSTPMAETEMTIFTSDIHILIQVAYQTSTPAVEAKMTQYV